MASTPGLIPETENSLDQLFAALDGRPTDGPPARVLGIHDDGKEWWIQVARGDDATDSIVLRLSRFASVSHAGAALRRWHPSEPIALRFIHAMCLL